MIDRLTGMPEWFDLQRYNDSKDFSLSEWHRSLSYRAAFKAHIDSGRFSEEEGDLSDLMILLEDPLNPPSERWEEFEVDPQSLRLGVYALDLQDGLLIGDIVRDTPTNDHSRWLSDPLPEYKGLASSLRQIWFREDHFIGVDLSVDNDRLVELFKEHLKVARERLNRPKPWKVESMLLDLFDHKILPLIDLMLWQDATGYKLRNMDLISALNYSGNQDLVRVKIQNAHKVMGEPFLNTLLAIAARKSKV